MKKPEEFVLRRQLFSLVVLALLIGLAGFIATRVSLFNLSSVLDNRVKPGYYVVTAVNDGDTIVVDMDGRKESVRFIGVDTPETHKPETPIQCWGPQATDFTTDIIKNSGNQVRLEADPINTNRDRYDRLLRYVYLPDGTFLNAKLIGEGQGFAYTSFPFQKTNEFTELEQFASNQKKGLWAKCEVELDNYGVKHTTAAP